MAGSRKRRIAAGVGIVVAVIGVIVPVVWDRYKSQSALELQLLSVASLLNPDQSLERIQVLYDDKRIRDLTRLSFALVNSGRTPFRMDDVASWPEVIFNPPAEILDVSVDRRFPPEIECTNNVDGTRRRLLLQFPLLNPGDRIELSVLVSGEAPQYKAYARISGLSRLEVVDRRGELSSPTRKLSKGLYFLVALTLFLIWGEAALLVSFGREREVQRLWSQGLFKLPASSSPSTHRAYVKAVVGKVKTDERIRGLLVLIDEYKNVDRLTDEQTAALDVRVREVLGNFHDTKFFLGFVGLLAAFAAFNVVRALL